jgi:PTH1 family peptidyl-tRNA hydrolase
VYLVAGLGNPGERYSRSRHNVGFLVIDQIARSLNFLIEKEKFHSLWGECRIDSLRVIVVKPQTFMNLSGGSIRRWILFYQLPLENVLVVHDDVDLEFGRLKFVRGGGAGGHKGVESILYELGSDEFPRLKIGIGRPRRGEAIEDFVLAPFYPDQTEVMETVIVQAGEAVKLWCREGISKAMNVYNRTKNI